jgi:hypothetical protein
MGSLEMKDMSLVQFSLDVESYNSRSNQIAVKLIVENNGDEKVKLISLTPNVPLGVELEERRDTSHESKKEKAIDLCIELTEILDGFLLSEYENIKQERISVQKEMTEEIFKVGSPFSISVSIFSYPLKAAYLSQEIKAINRKLSSTKYYIQNLEDAKWAYDKWFASLDNGVIEKGLFEGKLQQLRNLEEKMSESESNVLAIIEPDSSYTRSYVIRFKRKKFSQKMFNITMEGVFSQDESLGQYRRTVSEPVSISPSSFALTFLAVIASVLGSILKFNLGSSTSSSFLSYFDKLFTHLTTGHGISSAIVAIVFFNIYEHINFGDFGKNINQSPNWQVALLIGTLSGLMADKIVKALSVFIGI